MAKRSLSVPSDERWGNRTKGCAPSVARVRELDERAGQVLAQRFDLNSGKPFHVEEIQMLAAIQNRWKLANSPSEMHAIINLLKAQYHVIDLLYSELLDLRDEWIEGLGE